jgi:hypothetical protein
LSERFSVAQAAADVEVVCDDRDMGNMTVRYIRGHVGFHILRKTPFQAYTVPDD